MGAIIEVMARSMRVKKATTRAERGAENNKKCRLQMLFKDDMQAMQERKLI
jgi:hypothetical protein